MIILEGPDKAGKTTFASALCEKYDGHYFHFGVPNEGVCHIDEFKQALKTQPFNTVFDRGCLSAFAYDYKSPTDPNRIMTTLDMLRDGISAIRNEGALLVYVCASDEVLAERLRNEGDANDYVNERELLFTSHLYDMMWEWMPRNSAIGGVHALPYDTSVYSVERFMKEWDPVFTKHLVPVKV